MKNKKTKCIVILGMHRSGTSMLAGCLYHLGIPLGNHLIPAAADNPRGYFELAEAVEFNNRIISSLGRSHLSAGLLHTDWHQDSSMIPFEREAIGILVRNFQSNTIFGLKDPRLCLTIPLWLKAFASLNISPVFIHQYRQPLNSAMSLSRRDGISTETALELWIEHAVQAERVTRAYLRHHVLLPELIAEPIGVLQGIEQALDLHWPITVQSKRDEIKSFIEPSLLSHTTEGTVITPHATKLLAEANAIYDAIKTNGLKNFPAYLERNIGTNAQTIPYTDQLFHPIPPPKPAQQTPTLSGTSIDKTNAKENESRIAGEEQNDLAELFIPIDTKYTEEQVIRCKIQTGVWAQVAFTIKTPITESDGQIRLDPCCTPGMLRIRRISLFPEARPALPLYECNSTEDFAEITIGSTAIRMPSDKGILIACTGTDPQLILPKLIISSDSLPAKLQLDIFISKYTGVTPAVMALMGEIAGSTNQTFINLDKQITTLEETIIKHDEKIENLRQTLTARDTQNTIISQVVTERDTQITTLSHLIADRDSQISSLSHSLADRDSQISSLSHSVADRDSQISSLSHSVADRDSQISSLSHLIADRDSQISSLSHSVADRDSQISSLSHSVADRDSQISSFSMTVEERNAQIAALSASIADLSTQFTTTNNRLFQLESSLTWRIANKLWQTIKSMTPRFLLNAIRRLTKRTQKTTNMAVSIDKGSGIVRNFLYYLPGYQAMRDLRILKKSGLFDVNYYLDSYPDIKASGTDPMLHYLKRGWKEHRNPSACFDTAWYLQKNPDVAASGIVPIIHFIEYGFAEERTPLPPTPKQDSINDNIYSETVKTQVACLSIPTAPPRQQRRATEQLPINSTTYAFTSICLNYLPKAVVLAETLKQHNPQLRFCLLVNEPIPTGLLDKFDIFDEVATIDDLNIPNKQAWLFGHTVVELCTAVKGFYLVDLLERPECAAAFYFDPDIAVFSSIDTLVNELQTRSILLTPHLTEPEKTNEGIIDNEICALQHGIYNLGFLGVKPSEEGLRFARWWRDRLHQFCRADIPAGLFTDQRWVDLAPAFFTDLHILRHPGCNISTWNLSHRMIEGTMSKGFTVNGLPLIFYHFSGFDSGAQEGMLNKYGKDMPAAYELRKWYLSRTERPEDKAFSKRQWRYNYFNNGEQITAKQRSLFRDRTDLQNAFSNPFDTDPPGYNYYEWYRAEVIKK